MSVRVTLSEDAQGSVALNDIDLAGSAFDVLGGDDEVVLFEGLILLGIEQHEGRVYFEFEDTSVNPSRYLLPVDSDLTLRYC